jgi:ribonuclease HI
MKNIVINTDGACKDNPGPGGWAFLCYVDIDVVHKNSGSEPDTTNNRMELLAIINSLKFLKSIEIEPGNNVQILSDSSYVVNCFKDKWFIKWFNNNYKNAKGEPVLNKDMWIELFELMNFFSAKIEYVRSRSTNENIMVDKMAKAEAWRLKKLHNNSQNCK